MSKKKHFPLAKVPVPTTQITVTQQAPTPERGRLAKPRDLYSIPGRQQVTPDRISSALKDLDNGRFELFADVMTAAQTDPVVKRAYDIRRSAVAGRKFTVEAPPNVPPEMKQAAEQAVDLAKLWLNSLASKEATFMRILDYIGMGISVHEMVWENINGTWLPRLMPVMTREIRYNRDWTVSVRNSSYEWVQTDAHPAKFLVINPMTNNARPVDQGAFLSTVFYWLFKRGGVQFWMSGAERFGTPLALAKMAIGADMNQKMQALADLQQMTSDTVGVVSGVSDIEIIDAKAAGSTSVWKELLALLDTQIFLSLGVSPDLLLVGPNGGRSSTEVRDGVRLESSKLDATLMWGSIIEGVIKPLVYYNLRRTDIPMPVIKSIFDDSMPITRDTIEVGAATVDEVRAGNGLPAWGPSRGGDKPAMLPQAQAVQAAPTAESVGGTPSALPLPQAPANSGLPPLTMASQTSLTHSPSVMSQHVFGPVRPSGDPTS